MENVAWSAPWIFVNVASSTMSNFRAKGLSYFFTKRKVMMLPRVFPRAPAIIVGIKRSEPVEIK